MARPRSLAVALSVWYATILVVFFVVAFLVFYMLVASTLKHRVDDDLREDVTELSMVYRAEGLSALRGEIAREVAPGEQAKIFLRLVDANGIEHAASDLSGWRLPLPSALQFEHIDSPVAARFRTIDTPDGEHRARVASALLSDDRVLQIGESLEESEDLLGLLLGLFAAVFAVVVGLSLPLGWWMARRALRGIDAVSRAAGDIAGGQLDRHVDVPVRGAEIERLVSAFNLMVTRIRALITGMREMTDNIAHDLRSPLARIRMNAEGALTSARTTDEFRSAAAETLEECDRLLRMINNTLDVAEAEAGAAEADRQRVDLSMLAREACDLFEPVAERKGVRLDKRIEGQCEIQGHLQHLQRMLANLLDNALKFTPSDGFVEVSLTRAEDKVILAVRDSGEGIAEEDQRRVFDRYFRCDRSRSDGGCGLGLSFANAVARAHGGVIRLQSRLSKGSTFLVELPARSLSS